jgi:predicted phage terminase large subunit-like protein
MDESPITSWRAVKHRRGLRGSLAAFIKEAWPVVEPESPLDWSWHLDAICLHLEAVSRGDIRRLIINIPPGHAKSLTVAVLWPAWTWTWRPGWRALFASYAAELAIRDSVRCRRLIESDWYQDTIKPEWKLAADQNVKHYFENDHSGSRLALGVQGKGTGYRGDAVVVDDALSVEQAYSDTERKRVNRWYDTTYTSRLNDKRSGAQVAIGQRLHVDDLSGHLLRKGGWDHLNLPTEYDKEQASATSIGWSDPRTSPGELLFPSRYPAEIIQEIKTELGSRGYAAQHQQRPTQDGGNLFRREWWQRGTPPADARWLQSWDLTFKSKRDSDFVVGLLLATKGALAWIVDVRRARLDFTATLRLMQSLASDPVWRQAGEVLVEDTANGPAVISALRSSVRGLVPITPKGSKFARAAAVAPQVEAGQVYLHPGAQWVDGFMTELAQFPFAAHDDQVDALSQALARVARPVSMFGPSRKRA